MTNFNPLQDGKPRLPRDPLSITIRGISLCAKLLFSKHPEDGITWLKSMFYRSRPLHYPTFWFTFDAIRELQKRIKPGMNIFEYGSGHSTLYLSNLKVNLVSIEDNYDWFLLLKNKLQDRTNVKLFFESVPDDYVDHINNYNQKYDVVIVDGSHRKACIKAALEKLEKGGLLVVDNTDWHWFQKDKNKLIPENWDKLVFNGFAPFIGHRSETSIYIKT